MNTLGLPAPFLSLTTTEFISIAITLISLAFNLKQWLENKASKDPLSNALIGIFNDLKSKTNAVFIAYNALFSRANPHKDVLSLRWEYGQFIQNVLGFFQGIQEQLVGVLVSLRPDDKEGKLAFRAADYGLTEQDKQVKKHTIDQILGKPINITGRWKYRCTVIGDNPYQWGGTCSVDQENPPLGTTWRLSGRREWEKRDDTKQTLTPPLYWETEWGTITDKKTIRFAYFITKDRTIRGYAFGIINEVSGVADAIDGEFFQLPPTSPEHGLLEFRRMQNENDIHWEDSLRTPAPSETRLPTKEA
jgi:hypothetical protein